jgi:hypothetical protein
MKVFGKCGKQYVCLVFYPRADLASFARRGVGFPWGGA